MQCRGRHHFCGSFSLVSTNFESCFWSLKFSKMKFWNIFQKIVWKNGAKKMILCWKKFSKKKRVKKLEKIMQLWYFIMDFFHFFSKNYFFLLKTQKEIWEIFFTFLEYSVRWLFSRINIIFGLVKIAVKSNGSKKKMSFSQNCSNGSVFGVKHIFSFWRNIFSKRCDVSKFQKKFCFLDFSPNFQYFWKVEEPPKRFLRDVLTPCFCKMKLFYPKFQKEKKLFPLTFFLKINQF